MASRLDNRAAITHPIIECTYFNDNSIFIFILLSSLSVAKLARLNQCVATEFVDYLSECCLFILLLTPLIVESFTRTFRISTILSAFPQ